MQCFTKEKVNLSLPAIYESTYTSKQLFKSQTIAVKIHFSHPEYRLAVNSESLVVSQFAINLNHIVYLPISNTKQLGILDLKSGSMRTVQFEESLSNVHFLNDHIIIITASCVLYGPLSLLNSSSIVSLLKVLINLSGPSCICLNYVCIAAYQGITVCTIDKKSYQIPLVGDKQDIHSYNQYIYSSGKIGYIYDISARYTAYTGPLPGKWVTSYITNTLYLVNDDCFVLKEKDIYHKVLQAISSKSFELGILLIEKEPPSSFHSFESTQIVYNLDTTSTSPIFLYNQIELKSHLYQLMGDHTYDYDSKDKAMQYYIETIGYLEPSNVILKYMSVQQIESLMDYLEALHFENASNSDHTTLLLNCYSKTKSINRLNSFLKHAKDIIFNPEIAIKVTRETGHTEQALLLCKQFNQHNYYLKIALEDANDPNLALLYLRQLESIKVLECLTKYGRSLVQAIPSDMTDYFKSLVINDKILPELFIAYFNKELDYKHQFLKFCCSELQVSPLIWTALVECCLQAKLTSEIPVILHSNEADFDLDQLLLICHSHDYHEGKLILLKRMNMEIEIVRVYMESNDPIKTIESVELYGNQNKQIWMEVLEWLAHQQHSIQHVLNCIEARKLATPLEIVQLLSKCDCQFDIIKPYLIRHFSMEKQKSEEMDDMIAHYTSEIAEMSSELQVLQSEPLLLQATTCSACLQPLNLPMIHYYCKHSYHQSCLGEQENCPRCIDSYESPIGEENEQMLLEDLEEAEDAFGKMTEYFSRHSIRT